MKKARADRLIFGVDQHDERTFRGEVSQRLDVKILDV